jgi:hypothetical protein
MQELNETWEQGKNAYRAGKKLEDNPYCNCADWYMLHIAWQMGYCYEYQLNYKGT